MKYVDQIKMLQELVAEDDRLNENDIEEEGRKQYSTQAAAAMRDMHDRLMTSPRALGLTDKQLAYVKDVYSRVFHTEFAPTLMSSGLIPRGKEVELPPVLRNLPKAPPGRKASIR